MKQGITAEECILRHWWISVILKIRSCNLCIKSTKPSRTPRWHCRRPVLSRSYVKSKVRLRHRWRLRSGMSQQGLQGCAGQAADAVSAYTQVNMEEASSLLKIPQSECPDIRMRLPKYRWPKSWSSMEDPVVPLGRDLYRHPLAGLLCERQVEKGLLEHGWETFPKWECLFVNREKGYSCLCMWTILKLAGKKQNIGPRWKVLVKDVDLGEPTSLFDHVYLVALNENVKQAKVLWTITEICLNPTFLQGLLKSCLFLRNLSQAFLHGPMIWKVMQRNASNDIANWRTEQPNSNTKSQLHALTTWDLLENCQTFAHKLL